MSASSTIQTAITVVLVVIALALVVGQLLGQPLLIGYVETGSMEPTLEVGDGFVAMPTILAGDLGEGDVVTFQAQSIGGGGITTHRIAEETPEGYITRGDANTFDDQDAGEPPVQDAQIVAVVLQFNGEIVVLPSIGNAAQLVQGGIGAVLGVVGLGAVSSYGIGAATTGFGVVLIVFSLVYGFITSEKRPTVRSANRDKLLHSRWLLAAMIVVLLLPLMTSMVIPSDTTTIEILSTNSPDDAVPTHIQAGQTDVIDYSIENNLFVPKLVVVESGSSGVEFSQSVVPVSHGEVKTITLRLSAPEETGRYTRSRSEYHYYHILPAPVIVALHEIHPLFAMMVISGILILPAVVLFVLLVGLRPISIRPVYD